MTRFYSSLDRTEKGLSRTGAAWIGGNSWSPSGEASWLDQERKERNMDPRDASVQVWWYSSRAGTGTFRVPVWTEAWRRSGCSGGSWQLAAGGPPWGFFGACSAVSGPCSAGVPPIQCLERCPSPLEDAEWLGILVDHITDLEPWNLQVKLHRMQAFNCIKPMQLQTPDKLHGHAPGQPMLQAASYHLPHSAAGRRMDLGAASFASFGE
ncbi:hypothetical protein TgHK011_007660 [Trichoderma gracile]|nr:hypothetical protein TgHK011_007660 [Trichoderma gracile]